MSAIGSPAQLPPARPRRTNKRDMLIPKHGYCAPASSVLAEMSGPLPPAERQLLRTIARRADVIAQAGGSVFLLLELSPLQFDRLSAFEAGAEDLEETDQGGDQCEDEGVLDHEGGGQCDDEGAASEAGGLS